MISAPFKKYFLPILVLFCIVMGYSFAAQKPAQAEIFSENFIIDQAISYKNVMLPKSSSSASDFIEVENEKLVIVGKASTGEFYTSNTIGIPKEKEHTNLVVWKYKADGSLDTSFGYGGLASIAQGYATHVKVQSQGKYIVAGMTYSVVDASVTKEVHLYRYAPYGLLDISFASLGTYSIPELPLTEINDIAITKDDSILLLGHVSGNTNAYLIKCTKDGETDSTFGTEGILELPDNYNALILDEYDNIYLVGTQSELVGYSTYYDTVVLKLSNDGAIDQLFGTGGRFVHESIRNTSGLSSNFGISIAFDPVGSLYISGEVLLENASRHIFLSKISPQGTLDTKFGTQNGFTIFIGNDSTLYSAYIRDISVLPSGKVVVTGNSSPTYESSALGNNFLLLQFNTDGTLDTHFNTYGYYRFPFPSSGEKIITRNNNDFLVTGSQSIENLSYMNVWNITVQPVSVSGGVPITLSGIFEIGMKLEKDVYIKNVHSNSISITEITVGSQFQISNNHCDATVLLPLETCSLTISFTIAQEGITNDTLLLSLQNFSPMRIPLVASIAKESPVYRFFNTVTGAHLYTVSEHERDTVMLMTKEWQYEGPKYSVLSEQLENTVPVYRFFNTQTGAHIYTISEYEKNQILAQLPHYTYEGIKYYVYEHAELNTEAVYRFFNTRNGAHIYTINEHEKQTIIDTLPFMHYEGIKFYVKR